MNSQFGWSRNVVAILIVLAAAILTVLAGLAFLALAAMRGLAFPGNGKPVPETPLLLAILVLLVAIFVLLLILLWCCCRCGKDNAKQVSPDVIGALAALLPLLPNIRTALHDTAIALHGGGKALGWIQQNLSAAAGQFGTAHNNAQSVSLWLPKVILHDPGPPTLDVTAAPENTNPLAGLVDPFQKIGQDLAPNVDQNIGEVSNALLDAGKRLGLIANALHDEVPDEVINPS